MVYSYTGPVGEAGHLDLKMVQICKFRIFGPQNMEPFISHYILCPTGPMEEFLDALVSLAFKLSVSG